jgi:hypothetical protein
MEADSISLRGPIGSISPSPVVPRGDGPIVADADDSYDWSETDPFIDRLGSGAALIGAVAVSPAGETLGSGIRRCGSPF